jgi:hypothetical protein
MQVKFVRSTMVRRNFLLALRPCLSPLLSRRQGLSIGGLGEGNLTFTSLGGRFTRRGICPWYTRLRHYFLYLLCCKARAVGVHSPGLTIYAGLDIITCISFMVRSGLRRRSPDHFLCGLGEHNVASEHAT